MILTAPMLVMSGLLSAIYGLAYGLLAGKAGRRLLLYVLIAALGFAAGFPLSQRFHLSPYVLGDLPILECTLASLAATSLAYLLRI